MTHHTSWQGARRHLFIVAACAVALTATLWIAGCGGGMGSSSAPSIDSTSREPMPKGTVPPPPAPIREWGYSEAPAVPAGLKPHQLLKNLTFASGSSSLDREGQGALMEAVKELKTNTRWHVLAVGFADNRGEGASVAEARASGVKKFLQGQGIDAARISTQGLGSKYATGKEYEPNQQALDRRVEVWAFMD